VVTLARWMLVATLAMLAYAASCVVLGHRTHVPVWLVAGLSWLVWFAVAASSWLVLRGVLA